MAQHPPINVKENHALPPNMLVNVELGMEAVAILAPDYLDLFDA